FPMLPLELSTDLTSLLDAQDRRSVVLELHITDSGEVDSHDVYTALIRNHAKLTYHATGTWLEGRGALPPAVGGVPRMGAQLRLQEAISKKLRLFRKAHGALTFGSVEPVPVVDDGQVKDLKVSQHTVAESIIESFMVAANVAMAQHLRQKGSLSLRRVVRTP